MRSVVVLIALGLSLIACGTEPDGETGSNPIMGQLLCTQEAVSGISVEVRDAASGAPAACGATGTFQEAAYVEALSDAGQCSRVDSWPYLYGAFERAGTYRVTVSKLGYETWVLDSVTVTSDGCHVQPVALQANLEPL